MNFVYQITEFFGTIIHCNKMCITATHCTLHYKLLIYQSKWWALKTRLHEILKCWKSKMWIWISTCLSDQIINRFVKFQLPRSKHFGFRAFQSFRRPWFFLSTIYILLLSNLVNKLKCCTVLLQIPLFPAVLEVL